MTVSSARIESTVSGEQGLSAVYKMYRSGPSTLPCDTAAFMGQELDTASP